MSTLTARVDNPPSLQSRRVLVTGANGGLGLATCIRLLNEGAELTMACRTADKAATARDLAVASAGVAPNRVVAAGGFDMLDPSAIDDAVAALPPDAFDVVFLQAGGWVFTETAQTVQRNGHSVEKTVFKNVVGAHATLLALWESGRVAPGCRVVIIGGEGARGVPRAIARPEFDGLHDFRRYLAGDWQGREPYSPIDALGAAKFCAALWARHLGSEADGRFEVVWFTPGLIGGTGGTAGMPAWKEFVFQRLAFPLLVRFGLAQWPDAAAAKCVDCLAGRIGENGDLIGAPEGKALGPLTDQTPMHPAFTDSAMQQVMWDLCVEVVGPISKALRTAAVQ
jgi:NAD(P)-dependent dehydrogenase (short-subunit alcohol dehydrogenase family)